jgi:hypothetical protein
MSERFFSIPDSDRDPSDEDIQWAHKIIDNAAQNVLGPKREEVELTEEDFSSDEFWNELLNNPPQEE